MERIKKMDIPNTRAEFEYRFHLLKDMIEQERFHVNQGISLESLRTIRYLPNGRIDFLSVNEQARLTANMMVQMQNVNFQKLLKEHQE